MLDPYPLLRPALFKLDPERAHRLTIEAMKRGLVPDGTASPHPALEQRLWHLRFANPVGLAAGFDKNAEAIGGAFRMGFGFVEVGTVTPKPQHGNPRPRIFRDPLNEAVINRMGFPNGGMNSFKDNFQRYLRTRGDAKTGIIGINIGMNKNQDDPIKDYTVLIRTLGPMADYITVNVSSPNTPGLRDLQRREKLLALVAALREEREKACGRDLVPPILIKLAPDLDAEKCEEIAEAVLAARVDGLILTNTTLERPKTLPKHFAQETGGLSGQPLTQASTAIIRTFYKLTQGALPIIGVGGVSSGLQAYQKIKAGASLVQLYTGLVFQGPMLVRRINEDLLSLLRADGHDALSQAVGADHRKAEAA